MERGNEFVSHSGILGMKWGKRRFQYKNGTYTPEGILRYRKLKGVDGDNDSEGEKKYNSGTKKYKAEEMRTLTDNELNERNKRLAAENNYRDALKKNHEYDVNTNKKKAMKKIFLDSAQNAAANVMQTVYTKVALNFVDKFAPGLNIKKN